MSAGTVSLQVIGETLILHPQRAVLWPRAEAVIVADTHFGKSSYFARHGIAVPAGSDEADRQRLSQLIHSTAARRLIILGDFLHAPPAENSLESRDLHHWVDSLAAQAEIHIVAGNHDKGFIQQRMPSLHLWGTEWVSRPFRFIHDAHRIGSKNRDVLFTLSGHVHPVMRLRELKKRALRVPVFWQTANGLVLPSFGAFTGGFAVVPGAGERMFAVDSSGVVPFG
jgi:DNA ligase-associated metallophosphoesterase